MNANARTPDGTHLVVEYSNCEPGILNDPETIEELLVKASESIGAKVVERIMHQFRPNGVTGCVISSDSHLTIHTWPLVGYASVDLYTCRDCDIQLASDVLSKGLNPQSTETILVDRGMNSEEKLRIRGYRRVATYTLDICGKTPDSINIARSPGRGFGHFSNQDFEVGDLIYDTPGTLAEWDSEFVVKHDGGRSVHSADSLGYELTPELIKTWPQSLKDAFAEYHELEKDATPEMLLQALSDDYECEVLITGFDGLKNHSNDANTLLDWSGATVSFNDDEEPVFSIPTRAIKPIQIGDELFVDYSKTLPNFVPPADWLS